MEKNKQYDVIVIGGGHAGCEAAAASARLGVNTALFTNDKSFVISKAGIPNKHYNQPNKKTTYYPIFVVSNHLH